MTGEKEDHHFFPAAVTYLRDEGKGAMLKEFWDSDRRMIHPKYETRIDRMERNALSS